MLKVLPLPPCLLMNPHDSEPGLGAPPGARFFPPKLPLGLGKPFLGLAIPAGIVDLLPAGEGRKGMESQVDPDFRGRGWIESGRDLVTGKAGIPLPSFDFQGAGLGTPFQGPVKLDPELPDARKPKPRGSNEREGIHLRPSQAAISIAALESGIPRLLSALGSVEEALKGELESNEGVLQNLGMDPAQLRPNLLDLRKLTGLCVIGDGDPALPCFATLLESSIVDFTAQIQPRLEEFFLCTAGVQAKFEGASHNSDDTLALRQNGTQVRLKPGALRNPNGGQ